jgi:hypothetical protein
MPVVARHTVSNNVSAFSPYCRIAGIPLIDEEPISHDGYLYFEVIGTDLWLVQSSTQFFVSNSEGIVLSKKYWNPGYAVQRFLELRELEENGLL